MKVLFPAELTKTGYEIRQDGDWIYCYHGEDIKNHIGMSYSPPAHIYEFIKRWTGLEQHDFELRIEYPPMHWQHPKGELPELFGERRKPYLHIFE